MEFLKQSDTLYGMNLMESDEMKEVIATLAAELPKEDTSEFSFDRRSKDNKENEQNGSGPLSLDDLFERYEELQAEGLGDKTEEGQELRAMIRGYIDQERLPIRITRSTSNRELLDMIERELEGPKPEEETEAESDDEEQAEERPRRRR